MGLWGQNGERLVWYWPPYNELVFFFWGSYVCANFGENRSENATVRVPTDGHTHWQTWWQTQTYFIICAMLYAVAMGQIIMLCWYLVTGLGLTANVWLRAWSLAYFIFFQFLLQLQLFLFLDTIIYSSYSKFLCYFSVILQFAHISTWTLSH